jgi:hypothetical protein
LRNKQNIEEVAAGELPKPFEKKLIFLCCNERSERVIFGIIHH